MSFNDRYFFFFNSPLLSPRPFNLDRLYARGEKCFHRKTFWTTSPERGIVFRDNPKVLNFKKPPKWVYITPHPSILIIHVVTLEKSGCFLGSLAYNNQTMHLTKVCMPEQRRGTWRWASSPSSPTTTIWKS